ncbi:hypothetical protein A2U01_0099699, partial [Trifolium medium]|nr:hypothetical protein [Trifolium medium]
VFDYAIPSTVHTGGRADGVATAKDHLGAQED